MPTIDCPFCGASINRDSDISCHLRSAHHFTLQAGLNFAEAYILTLPLKDEVQEKTDVKHHEESFKGPGHEEEVPVFHQER